MWDTSQGGSAFHAGTNRAGTALSTLGQYGPPDNNGLVCDKPTYHEGFALTGLAAYFMVTGDTTALSMARATFTWVDRMAHDSRYGWYYGWLDATGRVLDSTKDINYGMHWMEGMAWLSLGLARFDP